MVQLEKMDPNALTTAFFCEFVNNWFDIVNTRRIAGGLFENSTRQLNILNEVKNVKVAVVVFVSFIFSYLIKIFL